MSNTKSISEVLRGLPVLTATPPPIDVDQAPEDPTLLLVEWLRAAISSGAPEPHAMTLSTVGDDGLPNARVLILKNLDARGLWFATSSTSAKGA